MKILATLDDIATAFLAVERATNNLKGLFFLEYGYEKLSSTKQDMYNQIINFKYQINFSTKDYHHILLYALFDSFSETELAVIAEDRENINKLYAILAKTEANTPFENVFHQIGQDFFCDIEKRKQFQEQFMNQYSHAVSIEHQRDFLEATRKIFAKENTKSFLESHQIVPEENLLALQSFYPEMHKITMAYNTTFIPNLPANLKNVFLDAANTIQKKYNEIFVG